MPINMQLLTLKEALGWTVRFHAHLGECMQQCAELQQNERSQLLLTHLATHEAKLGSLVAAHGASAKASVLNTWVYEFPDTTREQVHAPCLQPFAALDTKEIMNQVEQRHRQVIELYSNLLDHAPTASAGEFLKQLLQIQQCEGGQMVHGANRLEDS